MWAHSAELSNTSTPSIFPLLPPPPLSCTFLHPSRAEKAGIWEEKLGTGGAGNGGYWNFEHCCEATPRTLGLFYLKWLSINFANEIHHCSSNWVCLGGRVLSLQKKTKKKTFQIHIRGEALCSSGYYDAFQQSDGMVCLRLTVQRETN